MDPFCRMIGEPCEHVGEPCVRIDVVELGGLDERVLGGLDERVNGGGAPAAFVGRGFIVPGVRRSKSL